jgi:hypothetical protein
MSSLSRLQAKKNLRAIMSYENWSKEDLIARLTLLEAEKELLPQHRTPTTPPPPNPRRLWKTFDFSSHPRRKIALKFCYSGWAYNGLAIFLSASVYMTRQTQAQAAPPPRPPETLARASPNQVPLQALGLHRQLPRREQSLKSGARQRGPRARRKGAHPAVAPAAAVRAGGYVDTFRCIFLSSPLLSFLPPESKRNPTDPPPTTRPRTRLDPLLPTPALPHQSATDVIQSNPIHGCFRYCDWPAKRRHADHYPLRPTPAQPPCSEYSSSFFSLHVLGRGKRRRPSDARVSRSTGRS